VAGLRPAAPPLEGEPFDKATVARVPHALLSRNAGLLVRLVFLLDGTIRLGAIQRRFPRSANASEWSTFDVADFMFEHDHRLVHDSFATNCAGPIANGFRRWFQRGIAQGEESRARSVPAFDCCQGYL
jgi:hypothetical protein